MASLIETAVIAHDRRFRIERAAEEWAAARSSVLEIMASNPDYLARLNRLAEAEDRLMRSTSSPATVPRLSSFALRMSGEFDRLPDHLRGPISRLINSLVQPQEAMKDAA